MLISVQSNKAVLGLTEPSLDAGRATEGALPDGRRKGDAPAAVLVRYRTKNAIFFLLLHGRLTTSYLASLC